MADNNKKLLLDLHDNIVELERQQRRQKEFENYKQIGSNQSPTIINNSEYQESDGRNNLSVQDNLQSHLQNSKIIKLNVGGQYFATTLTTLTKDKDSMLAAMFSGQYQLEKDESGCVFIDRDGKYFSYVLHYLRTNELSAEITEQKVLTQLQKEAQYYQLQRLIQKISESLKTADEPVTPTPISTNNSNSEERVKAYVSQGASPIAYVQWPSFPAKTSLYDFALEVLRKRRQDGPQITITHDGVVQNHMKTLGEYRDQWLAINNSYFVHLE
jgi:hypothetical protein